MTKGFTMAELQLVLDHGKRHELIRSADEIMYKDKAQRRKLRSAKAAVPEGGNAGNTTK